MKHQELVNFLENAGKDPSRLIFEDELTDIYNRRFLLHYFEHKISWVNLKNAPLSLIMMDVDHFKQINDTYGHQAGDQVLVWLAALLREIVGEQGMPIRYAGDEFMVLLLHKGRQAAMELGYRLIERVREDRFRPEGADVDLQITLSIGVASAPQDAQSGKELIKKADVALYYAKETGRDCLIDAREVDQRAVFTKTAFNQLERIKLVGRKQQLSEVTTALSSFSQQRNQFLIAEGPEGIGKSEFLETIRRNLARINIWRVKVSGEPQELFRPYYLMTRILVEILNQLKDKAVAAVERLNPAERVYIARIMPQLGPDLISSEDRDPISQRQFIFAAIHHFFMQLVGQRPIILFIDDMQYIDAATLSLLRHIFLRRRVPLFICGASTAASELDAENRNIPLESFYNEFQSALGIRKLLLTPLTAADIAKHIRAIFPNVKLPENFPKEIAQITRGNPLFLSEVLRQLIQDRKITLVGHQWIVEPLEEGYLPHSIEEMVAQKISALDDESRQMLDRISAFGEDVSLSILTGSSEKKEAEVLEFIGRAATQGLLSSEFERNDEIIRFLGKRILKAAYNAIEDERKQQLHEEIGNYKESLHARQLLPSVSPLAYHFQRSANTRKAESYREVQTVSDAMAFNPQEAAYYVVAESVTEATVAEVPLAPDDLHRMPKFIRLFMTAVRNIRLYPAGSKSIINANRQLYGIVEQILRNNDTLNILRMDRSILINGQKIDVTEFRMIADTFLQFLNRFEIQGIAFHRGFNGRELEALLQAFVKSKHKVIDQKYWERYSEENCLQKIELKQVRYAVKAKSRRIFADPGLAATAPSEPVPTPTPAAVKPLGPQELALIPDILRSFVGAVNTIKLYTLKSGAAAEAIKNLTEKLRLFFTRLPVLSLSKTGDALLLNGEKIDIAEMASFRGIADSFLKHLEDVGLESLTFLNTVTLNQMNTLFGAFGSICGGAVSVDHWQRIARERELTGILFNQHLYEIEVVQNLNGHPADGSEVPPTFSPPEDPRLSQEQFDELADNFAGYLEEMFLIDDQDGIAHMIGKLLTGLENRVTPIRKSVLGTCGEALEKLDLAFQHDYIKLLADPLLSAFNKEEEPKIISETAAVLSRLVGHLILLADYPLASRILLNLRKRYQKFKAAKDPQAIMLASVMRKSLEPRTHRLLVADLRSDDPSRQQLAAQLLEGLGAVVAPLLVDTIKQEEDYRVRQTAALLLRKAGAKAIEGLKHQLASGIGAEERRRILDIIDTLTRDVRSEFALAVADENPHVREAAYRLAERIKDKKTVEILLDFVKSHNGPQAIGAIECLGRLGSEDVEETLIELLNSSRDEQLRIACCRALGQLGKPGGIETLVGVLLPRRKFLFFLERQSARLRAEAALALGQITHPMAAKNFARFINDDDPTVRKLARRALEADASSALSQRQKSAETSAH